MVTLIAAGSSAPLGHHFGAFAVFLIAVVAGCLVWALRDGAQRGARDADADVPVEQPSAAPQRSAPGRHAAAGLSWSYSYRGQHFADDSPTVVIRLDGSYRA